MNKKDRITQLEQKAIKKYIETCDWDQVIEFLHEDDLTEYKKLIKEVYPNEDNFNEKKPTIKNLKKLFDKNEDSHLTIGDLQSYFNINKKALDRLLIPLLKEGYIFEPRPQVFRKL